MDKDLDLKIINLNLVGSTAKDKNTPPPVVAKNLDDLIRTIGAGGSKHRTLVDILKSLKI